MKRLATRLLIFLLILGFAFSASAEKTTLLTTVPSEHIITVTCGRGGSILYDGQTYAGTLMLSVPRFGSVSFKAVPDKGYSFSQLIANSESGIFISNNKISITNLFEDKTINLRFAYESKGDSQIKDSKEEASDTLYEKHIGSGNGSFMGSIVLDEYDYRQNYEWISILRHNDTSLDNSIMICADATENGDVEHRRLVLSFKQLEKLYDEHEFSSITFRNGNAVVMMELEDVFSNSICKLIKKIENNEMVEFPLLEVEDGEAVILTDELLKKAYIDVHIVPSETSGYSFMIYLDVNQQKIDITSLLPSLNIGIDTHSVEKKNPEYEYDYLVMFLNDDGESIELPSALMHVPTDLKKDYEETIEYFHVLFSDRKAPPIIVYEENIKLDRYKKEVVYAACSEAGTYYIVCLQRDAEAVDGNI